MRKCPKCKKWELDVQPEMDYPQEDNEEEHYFFKCWNCGFECSKGQAEENKYPSGTIKITKNKEK